LLNRSPQLSRKEKAITVLGCQHSRFQAKPLASRITEQGRAILKSTEKTIVTRNFHVVYGDTDSVMFDSRETEPTSANQKAEELAALISKRSKFLRLAVGFIVITVLLVQKKKYAALVWNPATNGTQIEKKERDRVRRDWSELTKSMSEFVIRQFMGSSGDRDTAIQTIIAELEVISAMMQNGGAVVEDKFSVSHPSALRIQDLIILKALKKSLDQCPENDQNQQASVARAMVANGGHVPQNGTLKFIICRREERELGRKARAPVDVHGLDTLRTVWWNGSLNDWASSWIADFHFFI
jgi:DNA polymerase alpha subunit A